MSDVEAIDFFTDRGLIADPYPYFDALRAQYAILYQISDLVKHNEWRKVHVMLKSPKLTARTIHGYFAP